MGALFFFLFKPHLMKYQLNSTQEFYYNRALLGLGVYTIDEIKLMTKSKKERILKVNNKALQIVSALKYKKLVELSNSVINLYFSSGNLYNQLNNETVNFTDTTGTVRFSNKELGITKNDIVKALLESGVLGPNFLNLE